MADVGNKFGDYIQKGFELYKNNLAVLILASLIAYLLTGVTLGILAGPMFAGLVKIVLRLHDNEQPPPVMGDVFQGFQYFLPTFLFALVWGLILIVGSLILSLLPCIGTLLAIALSLTGMAFLMFGLYLIIDQQMDFWPASMASIEKVKTDFFPYLGLAVVAGIIGELGALACGIGVFVTMPIYFTIIAYTYRDVFGEASHPPKEIDPPKPPGAQPPPAPDAPDAPESEPEDVPGDPEEKEE